MTTGRSLLFAPWVALVACAGCISYSGGARTIDRAQLAQPGWTVAAPTPEIRQRGARDCGAAALAMIAGRWQVSLSLAEAVAILPTPTPRGIQLGQLRDAARAQGLMAYTIAGDRDTLIHELRASRPVIVGLLLPYGRDRVQSHYEVIVAFHQAHDQFVTISPSRGWRVRSWADLDAEWRPGRPATVVLGHVQPASAGAVLHIR